MVKPFWKSKTILFNVISGIVIYSINLSEIGAAPELIGTVVAGANLILRWITKEPVGVKAT